MHWNLMQARVNAIHVIQTIISSWVVVTKYCSICRVITRVAILPPLISASTLQTPKWAQPIQRADPEVLVEARLHRNLRFLKQLHKHPKSLFPGTSDVLLSST